MQTTQVELWLGDASHATPFLCHMMRFMETALCHYEFYGSYIAREDRQVCMCVSSIHDEFVKIVE